MGRSLALTSLPGVRARQLSPFTTHTTTPLGPLLCLVLTLDSEMSLGNESGQAEG